MENKSLKTILFLTPVFGPLILIWGIYGLSGLKIGFLLSCSICILIILNQDRVLLRIYKAHPVPPEDLKEIKEKLRMLSVRAGVPVPSIYVSYLRLPGSFIIGKSRNKTSLVIPDRLLSVLNTDELEAMLAYNIAQIGGSIRIRTLAALMSYLLTVPASIIRWGAVFTGFGDYNDPAPKLIGSLAMGFVAPPAAIMIQSVTNRDYDANAAALCGDPKALISAIERLHHNKVAAYPSLGFLCLVDPQKENFFECLFHSHLPKELRIGNLNKKR